MSITVEIQTRGGGNFRRRIQQWQAAVADPVPLMEEGGRILLEDLERRAFAGLDVDDKKMPPTLRERGIGGEWRTIRGHPVLVEVDPNPPAGPPLIPHNAASRLLRLARTGHEHRPPNMWAAYLGWPGFTSDSGVEVLAYHRTGGKRLPRRDQSSHPSPTALKRWQQAFRDWLNAIRSRTP
jgi:hypothetical protein